MHKKKSRALKDAVEHLKEDKETWRTLEKLAKREAQSDQKLLEKLR